MRTLPADQVEHDLDTILDSIEQDGPLRVQLNGVDVAVILSPAEFEAMSACAEAAPAPHANETPE